MKLAFISLLLASNVFAQGFDPQCWKPRIGIEIDTILRKPTNGYFFANDMLRHPNSPIDEEQIMITGHPSNPEYMTVLGSGPIFNIRQLQVRKTYNMSLFSSGNGQPAIFGNFRTTKYKDAFIASEMKIYWADDNGDFDSSRYTKLRSSVQGNRNPTAGRGFEYELMKPYVAQLTNDTLDDIVLLGDTQWKNLQEHIDSTREYLLLFQGINLYKPSGEIAYSDSAVLFGPTREGPNKEIPITRHGGSSGDFRGTGRKDLITGDHQVVGNYFFFANDPPFSMNKLAKSLRDDTLMTRWENPHLVTDQGSYQSTHRSLRAFWKPSWDRSEDFVGRFNTDDERKEAWLFFRGGSDFGSKRLYLDSAELVIRHPFGKAFNLGYGMIDCGDMTGTGNTVIQLGGSYGQSAVESFYYVLGKASDDLIDISQSLSVGSGVGYVASSAPINANNDIYYDRVIAYDNTRGDSLYPWSSSLGLMHGSTRIPVRLNPKYDVSSERQIAIGMLSCFPSPASVYTEMTYTVSTGGRYRLTFRDVLGRLAGSFDITAEPGTNTHSIPVAHFTSGAYYLTLDGSSRLTGRIIIQR